MIIYKARKRYRNMSENGEEIYKEPINISDDISPSDNSNNIFLYSEITDRTVLEVRKKIDKKKIQYRKFLVENNLDINTEENFHINLYINSYGGSVSDSFNLFDYIKRSSIPIYTYVEGICASAASIISVSGHKRFMTNNSMIMIHQLSSWFGGKYEEFQDEKANLDLIMTKIKDIYIKNTNLKEDELENLIKRDIYLDSKLCLEYGFVDEVI